MGMPRDPNVSPEAILAYLDGEGSPTIAAALQASPERATLAADYTTLQGGLIQALYRRDCPPTQSLGEYALELLPMAERVALATHVTDCPHCASELAQIRMFLAVEADPPRSSIRERARRVIVALLAPPPSAAYDALRGSGAGGMRTYQAADLTVTLDTAAATRRGLGNLTGLVWHERDDAATLTGAAVALIGANKQATTTTIDDLGNFAFDGVPYGDYRLELTIGEAIVVIEAVAIQP